ncbi:MAG: sterol desaturase family protein [Polyangiales bacterium]
MTPSLLPFALGGLTWNAAEYAIHRWVGHGPKRKRASTLPGRATPSGLAGEFSTEHLAHHADPSYFAPSSHKALAAVAVISMLGPAASSLAGRRRGWSYALGFTVMYLGYEVLHRRVHTHPPTSAYGRWRRRHHLQHHHRSPKDNHGVTSPLFDYVFGTAVPLQRVKVPRRQAPAWMLDDAGEVKPEYADDYELVGTRARPEASNEAPNS